MSGDPSPLFYLLSFCCNLDGIWNEASSLLFGHKSNIFQGDRNLSKDKIKKEDRKKEKEKKGEREERQPYQKSLDSRKPLITYTPPLQQKKEFNIKSNPKYWNEVKERIVAPGPA